MRRRLRRAEAADAEALSLVAGATFLEAYSGFIGRADMLAHLAANASPDRFRAWIADPQTTVTLAEAPGGAAPLGYTVIAPSDLPGERRPDDVELLRIYTLATGWGSGLGGELIERALVDARGAGHRRMLLGVHCDNHRAHRFYEKHGFAVIARRRFRVGDTWYDDPVYARDL